MIPRLTRESLLVNAENTPEAIAAWKQALTIQPDSPDSHMNLASAYILSNPPEPGAAIRHLK
jgi:cytochrome c-type biogenesis protein CcmH/NrfG